MLFDEQILSARRRELDRQAGRAGAYGAQSDVVSAVRSRRRLAAARASVRPRLWSRAGWSPRHRLARSAPSV